MISIQKSKIALILGISFCIFNSNAYSQQIALLDSGVDPNAGYNLVDGFNYIDNTTDTSDLSTRPGEGHGTVSARVITEFFSGEIVPFVIVDQDESMLGAELGFARDSALSDILGRSSVRIVAISRGVGDIGGTSSPLIAQLSNADKVIAILAGNSFQSQPNILATTSFNLSGVIIVGAADADGVLLPKSNRAGTTANKYVVAIGLPSLSATDLDDAGTSWATARIAGIAGAVLLQNPNLTAAQIVNVILQSAEDRGAEGTDSEYGRGVILNAEQVLNNVIGPVAVPTEPTTPEVNENSGGGGGGGGGGIILIGGAIAGAILLGRKSSTKLEKTLVLDSYGRAFEVDLNQHVGINDGSLHISEFFQMLDQTSVGGNFILPELNTELVFGATVNPDYRLDMVEYFSMPGDVVIENDEAEVSLAIRSRLSKEIELTAGYRVSPRQSFGAASQLDAHSTFGNSSFITGQSFSSPLSGFSSQGQTMNLEYNPSKHENSTYKLGLVSIDQSREFGQDSFSTILEGAYQFNDNAGLSLQFGQIEEQGSLFGGAAGGIFGVDTATTYALNAAGKINISEKYSVVGNYGIGRTHVDSSDDSLLENFSSLNTDWYSVGLIGNNVFRNQDQIGFAFSQPLKIRSGEVNYSVPDGRELNGDITFDVERISLSETGATETSLEGYYRTMLTKKLEFGGFVAYRRNPNHVSETGNEMLVMATLRFRQ